MPQEISRKVEGDKVIITYDDNTVKILETAPEYPENVVLDAEETPGDNTGHKFTKKELKDRGYND